MVLKELHFVTVVENPTRTLMEMLYEIFPVTTVRPEVEKTDIFRHPHR
jgi:hypothetical protein